MRIQVEGRALLLGFKFNSIYERLNKNRFSTDLKLKDKAKFIELISKASFRGNLK